LTPDIQLALLRSAEWHLGQERDGDHPLPYLTHPVEVLVNLRYVGGVTDPVQLCAAALHDVLEETSVQVDSIREQFGDEVATMVVELTRYEPSDVERAGLSPDEIWALRSRLLLEEIAQMSPRDQAVKLADRLSNLRESKRTKGKKKLDRYLGQTKEILRIVPREVNPGLWDAIKAEL
jgi:(p)ppGpp synthase/HD superfamily hydrolase